MKSFPSAHTLRTSPILCHLTQPSCHKLPRCLINPGTMLRLCKIYSRNNSRLCVPPSRCQTANDESKNSPKRRAKENGGRLQQNPLPDTAQKHNQSGCEQSQVSLTLTNEIRCILTATEAVAITELEYSQSRSDCTTIGLSSKKVYGNTLNSLQSRSYTA